MSNNNLTFKNLRIVSAKLFKDYLENTRLWCEIGNEAFAQHIISDSSSLEINSDQNDTSYRLFHSWRPEIMDLTESQAGKIQQLMTNHNMETLSPEMQQWTSVFEKAGWLNDESANINGLVDRALNLIIAIQNRYEITQYLELVQKQRPKVIVEIGTARGGMLYCFCQLAAPDALIISIDLPGAPNCGGQTESERQFYSSFTSSGQRLEFIPADSHLSDTKELLKNILQDKKVDVLFIDGDHSYEGVKKDYQMYKEFAAEDCLITFHDIKMYPKNWGAGNEVGLYWDEIAATQTVTEIVDADGMCKPNRPDGVEPCWGIGILGKH
ncbi:hypothetical protein MNBD_GAMMA05-602 [hydrothermal vent metagenome]|uniref:Uncharacterized protein n=1 Tax=hydrothermal vent metagenome TaxID=652676 RepID=A0A3B0X7Y8_9ZZZZ